MTKRMLFYLVLSIPLTASSQIGSVPGTLNQIHPDPEQKRFENEYQDLRDTIDELDEAKPRKTPSSKKNGQKKARFQTDRNKSEI